MRRPAAGGTRAWPAAASVWFLPALDNGGSDLEQLVSADNPAVQSEVRSFDRFGFPLLSRVSVVQRNPDGLPVRTQARRSATARTPTSNPSSRRYR